MDNFGKTIFWSFIGYIFIWLYTLFPVSYTLYKPFLFKRSQEITKQAFIDYASWRVLICLIFLNLWLIAIEHAPKYKKEFLVLFILWAGFLADYFLMYNDPVGYLKGFNFSYIKPDGLFIPLGYPLIMGLVMFVITIIAIKK
jgi:hypothetical protein